METSKPLPPSGNAELFAVTEMHNLEALMRFKRELIAQLGVLAGFESYKTALPMPDSDELHLMPLNSQHAFASARGDAFSEWAVAGDQFMVEPPLIIGEGARNARALRGVTRSAYVARLRDALVRGRSSTIRMQDTVLLDYQGSELDLFDWVMDIDPAIFRASKRDAHVICRKGCTASMEIDEGFMLLGPQSGAFGDWMIDYLPRYSAATLFGELPEVPVLIDRDMPEAHRRLLGLMLPNGVETIEIAPYVCVHVRRLWCAPALHYAPTREKMDRRFKFDYVCPQPDRIARVTREIARRADGVIGDATGPKRIYLARSKSSTWRTLVNSGEIEAIAAEFDFVIAFPDQLDIFDPIICEKEASICAKCFGAECSRFPAASFRPSSKASTPAHRGRWGHGVNQ